MEFSPSLIPNAGKENHVKIKFNALQENRIPIRLRLREGPQEVMGQVTFYKSPLIEINKIQGDPKSQSITSLEFNLSPFESYPQLENFELG